MKYKLQDLIDIDQFQSLQNRLNEIYSFPSAIIDNDGNILTATGWQDFCTKFHRINKDSEKECIESDRYILAHLDEANPAVSYNCPHGLTDNATPIIIDGHHMGNFFTGQFLLKKPDMEFFKKQAVKYGFDEAEYLEAVRKVPVWTIEQLNSYLFFIKGLIEIISVTGLKNLRSIEAGKKLQENEERQRWILHTAMDGFWRFDKQTRLLEVNETYCRMSGYSEQELLTMRVTDLEAAETEDETAIHIRNIMTQGEDRFESLHRRKDGSTFEVEVSSQYRPIENGQYVVFIRDITERKRVEESLRISEENFRAIFENSSSAIAVINPDTNIYMVNNAYCQLSGYTKEEVVGMSWTKQIPPDDLERLKEYNRRRLINPQDAPDKYEFKFYKKDGEIKHGLMSISMIQNSNKIITSFVDITGRKQAEEALRSSASELKKAQAVANVGNWVWHIRTNKIEGSDQLYKIFGIPKDTFKGDLAQAVVNATHPDDRAMVERSNTAVINDGILTPLEYRIIRPDGALRVVWDEPGELVRDEKGNPTLLRGIVQDITDRKKAEEEREKLKSQLIQAQKLESVGRLAGGVAHDFNNLLTVILANAEIALSSIDPENPLKEEISEIKQASEKAAELTRQLLAFARKQTVIPKILDINETVSGMLKMLRRLIGEDIDLIWKPGVKPGKVKIDPSQLDQILANLAINSRDAIEGVGNLTIETGNIVIDETYCALNEGFIPGEYVLLAVSDTGAGMDKETLGQIFEPFFTTKEEGKGTGLGLATIFGAVKQNNGFINVYSEPGYGTTFKIYLPAVKEVSEDVKSPVTKPIHGTENILIAEDESHILKISRNILEKLGYTVLAAGTPFEALSLAEKFEKPISLLITDVVMPGMNGKELRDMLAVRWPEIKTLFMSGYTANVIAHHGVIDEGIHFLQKPFSVSSLALKVREALDKS